VTVRGLAAPGGFAALAALAAALLGGCAKPQAFSFQEGLMHTRWDFSLVCRSQDQARAAEQEGAALIARLDETLAMWKPESELSAANRGAAQPQGVTVSADLAEVIGLALQAAQRSHGTFDPTVGPLTQAWYDARTHGRLLGKAEIARLMPAVGWQKVAFDPAARRLRFKAPGMRLDFGGIAKGYAQDRVAELFRRRGLDSFLMNAGGQVYAAGRKPDGSPWKVGIVNPRDSHRLVAALPLSDQCMATSGDYEQYSLVHGVRVHHELDPRTGYFVTNGVCSATSLVPAGADHAATWADVHGKPVFVLGPQAGLAYLAAQGAEGLVLVDAGSGPLKASASPSLKGLTLELDRGAEERP
jgi:thiamine biosynthesis lipoprotein